MKKVFVGFALVAFSSLAAAGGFGGGAVIGGGLHAWSGSVVGDTSSVSQGAASAGTQIIGNGSSFQRSDATAGGYGVVGGTISPTGTQVNTHTHQYTAVESFGSVSGNAVQMQYDPSTGRDVIINGTTGFGSSMNEANAYGTFQMGQIGVIGAIGGIGGIGAIGGGAIPQ